MTGAVHGDLWCEANVEGYKCPPGGNEWIIGVG